MQSCEPLFENVAELDTSSGMVQIFARTLPDGAVSKLWAATAESDTTPGVTSNISSGILKKPRRRVPGRLHSPKISSADASLLFVKHSCTHTNNFEISAIVGVTAIPL